VVVGAVESFVHDVGAHNVERTVIIADSRRVQAACGDEVAIFLSVDEGGGSSEAELSRSIDGVACTGLEVKSRPRAL
jgi:hypothetical protein